MNVLLEQLVATIRRHPLAVFVLALLAILGTGNYFLWQQREEVTRRHEEVQRKGEAMLLALTDHARITADLAAVKDAQQLIDRNLINEGSMAKNLGYFFQMETLSHVRISQLNQLVSQPSPEGNPFKAIPFSLRVTGSYSQIIKFLRELETGPRLLRIRTYSFVRGDAKNSSLALDLTVELLGTQ
jgi:Tfp pilus assembly protein PilO